MLDGEFDFPENRMVEVLPEHRGKVWSFTWDKPRTVPASLDDIIVTLSGNLAPLLWPNRDWAETCGPTMWQRHQAATHQQQRPNHWQHECLARGLDRPLSTEYR